MDATETTDLEYLLGSVPAPPAPVAPAPPISLSTPTPPPPTVPPVTVPVAPVTTTPPPPTAPAHSEPPSSITPKKRPLEDKKAREKKRILRNRELARVSNERRKGRIKAMEQELSDTRQTVTTLEESIRCLEAENKELRNLLTSKPGADAADPSVAGPSGAVSSVPQTLDPAVATDPSLPSSSAALAPQPPQP